MCDKKVDTGLAYKCGYRGRIGYSTITRLAYDHDERVLCNVSGEIRIIGSALKYEIQAAPVS